MEASSPLTFAIIGLVIGFAVGLACYRLFSKNQRDHATLKQALLEREHQIAELKKGMGSHLSGIQQHLITLRKEADQLEQQIESEAAEWKLETSITPAADAPLPSTESEDDVNTPRDYADGKSGTLSEDFGLKGSAKEHDASTPQPPRY
ncbi:DUF1043 family protein [Vreelandella andesensis]|uniref:DUF1043 family protein n=1 Tax=Vreelandella andesensis TaxID=447567 RepID=A0A3S0YY45_9GAMM|nr:DUF1043 family protein [Halomonas andesensis]RUR32375.1 DUF1043 family protein [Halomonas andesensis]